MTARQQLQRRDAAALGRRAQRRRRRAQSAARAAAVNTALANGRLLSERSHPDLNPSNDPNGDVVVGRWKLTTTGTNVRSDDPAPNAVKVPRAAARAR